MAQFAIAGGVAAASSGLSIFGALSKNSKIRAAMQRANEQAAEEIAQQGRVARLATARTRRDADRIAGAIRVSGADRGVGTGGSQADLERNSAFQGEHNVDDINLNRYGRERATFAQLLSTQTSLQGEYQDPFLAGLSGAISGFSSGLTLGQGIKNL